MTYLNQISILLVFISIQGCGPGAADYEEEISDGYSFSDAGHYERMILHAGMNGKKIVVDARVDEFEVQQSLLLVARRPRLTEIRNGVATSSLSAECEFIAINLATGRKQQMPLSHELSCN